MILALDFETANSDPGSVCAVGLAWFDGVRITGSWESLIRPHRSCRWFSRFNIAVHGITPEMARRRLDAQTPLDVLRAAATVELVNDSTPEALREKLQSVLGHI